MKKILLTFALLCGAIGAHAQQAPAKNLYLFAGGGLTLGGDQIGREINYESGNDQSLHAGGLVDLRVGAEFVPTGSPLSLQLSIGYHFDSAHADNGRASFDRFPLELLAHYSLTNDFRLGFGLRKALGAETTSSGEGRNYVRAQKYESSLGAIIEAEYFFTRGFALKVRGVSEKYKADSAPNTEVNGDHIGVLGVYYFK